MANAITDLALLNSGQVIPAEFWPDHFTKSMDEDRHRPWWELVPNPECDLTEEDLWEQQLELWECLSAETEEELNLDYLMEAFGLHGEIKDSYEDPEPPLVCFHRPPPPDVVVNPWWIAYVSLDKENLPIATFDRYESSPTNHQPASEALRLIANRSLGVFTRRELYRLRKRLREKSIQAHGNHGRKSPSHHQIWRETRKYMTQAL
jgi:hypothetical protein